MQCTNCQCYFTVPTRDQMVMQAGVPPVDTAAVAQVLTDPNWDETLIIMGPLCALLLVIGGGVTY